MSNEKSKCIIPNEIEKYITKYIQIDYDRISDERLKIMQQKIKNKYNITIDTNIIASMKHNFMKNHIITNFYKLNKHSHTIQKLYEKNNIVSLSKKIKLSPMTIMKFILENKYHDKISSLANSKHTNILSKYDFNQLNEAIYHDIYFQLDQSMIEKESKNFETLVENKLKLLNVKYKTQEQLVKEQIKQFGNPINTPDFLIESELILNNKKINWIDAKNFYGSNIKFIISKITKQVKKYISNYGFGCIIFRLGYNDILKFDNVLILCYDDFLNIKN